MQKKGDVSNSNGNALNCQAMELHSADKIGGGNEQECYEETGKGIARQGLDLRC